MIYKFDGGKGAVLCRTCHVVLARDLSREEAQRKWAGKDICSKCLKRSHKNGRSN